MSDKKNMSKAIERINHHLAIPTGPVRLKMIESGLDFEIRTGIRLTAKAPKCSTILRKEFGLSGKPESLLVQFRGLLQAAGLN